MSLKSTDGHRWAFMRPFRIPSTAHPERTYLWRLRIIQTPWFALYLHKIMLPDDDRHPHNHPFEFTSLILKGGYTEERYINPWTSRVPVIRHHRWLTTNKMSVGTFHRIISTFGRKPAWTLVFIGRRTQDWGFFTPITYIRHEDYFAIRHDMEIMEHIDRTGG